LEVRAELGLEVLGAGEGGEVGELGELGFSDGVDADSDVAVEGGISDGEGDTSVVSLVGLVEEGEGVVDSVGEISFVGVFEVLGADGKVVGDVSEETFSLVFDLLFNGLEDFDGSDELGSSQDGEAKGLVVDGLSSGDFGGNVNKLVVEGGIEFRGLGFLAEVFSDVDNSVLVDGSSLVEIEEGNGEESGNEADNEEPEVSLDLNPELFQLGGLGLEFRGGDERDGNQSES